MTTSASPIMMTFSRNPRRGHARDDTQSIGFNLSFRTIGDFGSDYELASLSL